MSDHNESYEKYQGNESLVNLSDLQQLLDKENFTEKNPGNNYKHEISMRKAPLPKKLNRNNQKKNSTANNHTSNSKETTTSKQDKVADNISLNNPDLSTFQQKGPSFHKESSIYNSMDLESLERMLRSTVMGNEENEYIKGDWTFSVDNNNMSPLRNIKDNMVGYSRSKYIDHDNSVFNGYFLKNENGDGIREGDNNDTYLSQIEKILDGIDEDGNERGEGSVLKEIKIFKDFEVDKDNVMMGESDCKDDLNLSGLLSVNGL